MIESTTFAPAAECDQYPGVPRPCASSTSTPLYFIETMPPERLEIWAVRTPLVSAALAVVANGHCRGMCPRDARKHHCRGQEHCSMAQSVNCPHKPILIPVAVATTGLEHDNRNPPCDQTLCGHDRRPITPPCDPLRKSPHHRSPNRHPRPGAGAKHRRARGAPQGGNRRYPEKKPGISLQLSFSPTSQARPPRLPDRAARNEAGLSSQPTSCRFGRCERDRFTFLSTRAV